MASNEAGMQAWRVPATPTIFLPYQAVRAEWSLSYFAMINYGYNGKYYLSLVGRRDGSSRYGVNNRFANFGSAGAAWNFWVKKKFMENIRFVNELKLRASMVPMAITLQQPAIIPFLFLDVLRMRVSADGHHHLRQP